MRIIHTSDWHLGNRLLGHSRQDEFQQFLEWLLKQMKELQADALLVSGDIFDTANPPEAARQQYCDFLARADETGCRHIIITAGNHDSPPQLEATRPLLARYHCSLVTRLTHEDAQKCLIPVASRDGREQALVCAVPHLHVRDVALSAALEDEEGRRTAYTRGIARLYGQVGELAAEWKTGHPGRPVIGMGHLTVSGIEKTASTLDIVGTLSSVSADIFPAAFDYTALGHIHRPSQTDSRHRYCGSPLAMDMDEGAYRHNILLLETRGTECRATEIPVPAFTQMAQCRCNSQEELHACVQGLLEQHALHHHPVWLELTYAGADISIELVRSYLAEHLPADQGHQTFAAKDPSACTGLSRNSAGGGADETLQNYTPETLFERKLTEFIAEHPEIDDAKQQAVRELFRSLLPETNA